MDKHTLLKYLNKSLNSSEILEVEKWILLSKDNSDFFNKVKSEFIFQTFKKEDEKVDLDVEYRKFKEKYFEKKPSNSRKLSTVLAYAAVVVVLISTTFFLYNSQKGLDNELIPQEITLRLENGKVINIDDAENVLIKDDEGGIIGKQEDGVLIYTADNSSERIKYNTITVPYGKRYKMKLSDNTTVHLGAGTSLNYPNRFADEGVRKITVIGEAYLDVAKDTLRPFILQTGNLNIRVLGTKFNVNNYPGDQTSEVVLVEGLVDLYSENDDYQEGVSTRLRPGYKASFDNLSSEIDKEAIDTRLYTSWINGELVFRDEPLESILKKLEKHFAVRFIVENKQLAEERFYATFTMASPIETIMQNLNANYGIDFEITGKEITIK